jgi:hypothetical protein
MHGQLNVGNGTIEGGMIVLANSNAVGSNAGVTAANAGNNTVGLQGNINIGDEFFVARGQGIGGLGSLRNLSGNNTWGGTVLIQDLAADPGGPVTGAIGVDAGSTLTLGKSVFVNGGGTASVFTMQKVGPGQLNVGAEQFTSGTASFQGSILVNNLDIAAGTVRLTPSGAEGKHVIDVNAFTQAAGTTLDLTNNAMVVDYASGGPSPFAAIRSAIVSGYAGGAWTGTGITSSSANAGQFALGYSENNGTGSGTNFTTFQGNPVDNSAVLTVFTRYGDSNLDGLVNLSDFNRLAANFGLAAGAVWGQGDFDYNGNVNLGDFNKLAANFGLSAGPDGVVGPDDWAALSAAVPEPSVLGLGTVAGVGLLRRRRTAR